MKIAFSMANMDGGGAERVVSELANNFVAEGHSVTILISKASGCVYQLDEQIRLIDLSVNNRGIFNRVKAIRKSISENHFDIVISFLTSTNVETIMALMGKKIPLIISERNNPYTDPKGRIYRLMRTILYPYANGYVFQTPDAQAFFSRRIRKKSAVIMNPINPNLPVAHTGERTKRIVNVGRLVTQKNHKMFIDAFCEFVQEYPDFIAEIYGIGPLQTELDDYILRKGVEGKILLKGFSKNVTSDIADASMFVMSSDYEGMSNALIEALGMGIPCISTDHPIGGARMIIEDGVNGFLVPVKDSHAMAEMMKTIAGDIELAKRISEKGILIRDTLSIEEISRQWLEYIWMIQKRCNVNKKNGT